MIPGALAAFLDLGPLVGWRVRIEIGAGAPVEGELRRYTTRTIRVVDTSGEHEVPLPDVLIVDDQRVRWRDVTSIRVIAR